MHVSAADLHVSPISFNSISPWQKVLCKTQSNNNIARLLNYVFEGPKLVSENFDKVVISFKEKNDC